MIIKSYLKLTVFVDATENTLSVIGEETLVVQVASQQFTAQVNGHVTAIVEAELVKPRLNSSIMTTIIHLNTYAQNTSQLNGIASETARCQNDAVVPENDDRLMKCEFEILTKCAAFRPFGSSRSCRCRTYECPCRSQQSCLQRLRIQF
jgi:hypothetical protein